MKFSILIIFIINILQVFCLSDDIDKLKEYLKETYVDVIEDYYLKNEGRDFTNDPQIKNFVYSNYVCNNRLVSCNQDNFITELYEMKFIYSFFLF